MDTAAFYDGLAEHYHLIFKDWEASVSRQGAMLDGLVSQRFGHQARVHDASAGIGTQILGLAARGYRVSASDLSPQAIERLRSEAERRGVTCPSKVCDMRHLAEEVSPVDVVISLDNSLPHLLSDDDIVCALTAMRQTATKGVVVSLRDYDRVDPLIRHQHIYEPKVDHGDLVTVFQLWEFRPGTRIYRLSMYMVRDQSSTGTITTKRWQADYYAITTEHLAQLFRTAGFSSTEVVRDVFYQPIIIGYT